MWLWLAGGSGKPSTDLTTPTIAGSATTDDGNAPDDQSNPLTYVIDPSLSVASFEIDEVLQGTPQTVVGTTDQVAGQFDVDRDDLSLTQFSQIVINVRTLTTDSERRDRTMRGPVILNSASDEFELATFDVASIDGLTGSATIGSSLEFAVIGDLTIKGETSQTTFDVTVDVVDDRTLSGTATTIVLRSDFGIGIPSVPGVANVSDEVVLSLEFVAKA